METLYLLKKKEKKDQDISMMELVSMCRVNGDEINNKNK